MANIVEIVAERYNLRVSNLVERDKRPEIAHARRVAMYVSVVVGGHSKTDVAAYLGNRTLLSVSEAIKNVEQGMERSPTFKQKIAELTARLKMAS